MAEEGRIVRSGLRKEGGIGSGKEHSSNLLKDRTMYKQQMYKQIKSIISLQNRNSNYKLHNTITKHTKPSVTKIIKTQTNLI